MRVIMLRIMTCLAVLLLVVHPAAAEQRWHNPDESWPAPNGNAPRPPEPSLADQSMQLRLQIQTLQTERSKYGIAGPIVMMAGGGGAVLGAAYLYLLASLVDDIDCYDYDTRDCGNDSRAFRNAMLVVGAAGVVVGVIGFVKLQERLPPRNELGAQIRSKRSQLQSIESRMRVGPIVGPQNLRGLSLAVSF